MASSSSTIFGSSSCCSCSVPLLCSLRPSSVTYGPWSSGLCFWGRRVGAPSLRLQVKSSRASEGSEQKCVTKGVITESLPNGMFWVRLDNGDVVLGYISGKIRRNSIRMLAGDKVKIEVSRYDSTRGRIVYRISTKET